jgi:hypothetical protein
MAYATGRRPERAGPREGNAMEIGDVVRVMTRDGRVGYFGEVVSLDQPVAGRVEVHTPDDGEVHDVPATYVRPATEAESDAYIARWIDQDPEADDEPPTRRATYNGLPTGI